MSTSKRVQLESKLGTSDLDDHNVNDCSHDETLNGSNPLSSMFQYLIHTCKQFWEMKYVDKVMPKDWKWHNHTLKN